MTDELKTRIETDEYIYEEYFDATQGIDQQPTPSMTAWNRSMRSLFHLQHKTDAPENQDCLKHIYEERNKKNRCVCDECFEGDEEND
jgi:hypothetical protein